MLDADVRQRLGRYAERGRVLLTERLGHGVDGVVLSTNRRTAERPSRAFGTSHCINEREVYRRLESRGVRELQGFAVPRLYGDDETLLGIEMSERIAIA